MSTASESFVSLLDSISEQLNRYFATVIFIFGILGNILNCCILSQRTLRSNPCALLFLVSSFINLISILVGLTTRILAGWQLDPTTTNTLLCKLRVFIVFSTRTIAIWLIALATVDRWLLSSLDFHRREKSTLPNVYKGIFLSTSLAILAYVHMLHCYEANIPDTPLKCYGKNQQCQLITDFIYATITIVLPSLIMIGFSLRIISNVRQLQRRMQTATIASIIFPGKQRAFRLRKTDQQLLRMLLVQVTLLIIFCIPQAIQKFYITVRPFGSVSREENAVNTFLYNIEVLLAFIASGVPFYLYTLSGGTVFRRASMHFFRETLRKILV